MPSARARTTRTHRRAARTRAWLALVVPFVLALDLDAGNDTDLPAPETQERDEYQLKTALLFNLMRYTRWPISSYPSPAEKAPFEIAVIGKDPYGKRLEKAFGGKVFGDGHRVIVRRYPDAKKLGKPQYVILGALPDEERDRVLKATKGKPILVVGEQPGICQRGAVFRIYMKDGRLAYQTTTRAVKACKLRIGPEILKRAEFIDP